MAKGRFHTSKTSNLSTSGQVKCFNLTNISAAHTHTHTHLVCLSVSLLTSSLCPHSTTISIYYGWCVSGFWVFAVNIYVSQWVALALDGTHTNTCTHMYLCRWAHTHTSMWGIFSGALSHFYDTINIIVCVIYGFRAIGPTVPCPLGHFWDIRSSLLHLNSDTFAFIY